MESPPHSTAPSGEGPIEPPGESNLDRLALVTLWTSGPDPTRDALFRVQALARDESGTWRGFDLFVDDPRAHDERADQAAVTRRLQREFGLAAKDLVGAPAPDAAWAALADFLDGAPLLVASRPSFEAWARHLDPDDEPFAKHWRSTHRVLALDEFHDLFQPGAPRPKPAPTPEALLTAFAETLHAIAALPPAALALIAQSMARAAESLWRTDRDAAAILTQALTLIEHPGWAQRSEALFDGALPDGVFSRALEAFPDPVESIAKARPRWHLPFAELEADPPLPPIKEGVGRLGPDDLKRIDEIFSVHLPAHFETKTPRAGQRDLANEIARTLGRGEVLLTQAPTGTGKTLAYLVPLALWALRTNLRTGVATFTRALQDQAAEREVPLALAMLKRAGIAEAPRIVRLKGRRNYLCFRALMRQVPLDFDGEDDADHKPDPARLLAWASLVAFAHTSPDGDLDGFPVGLALPLKGADLAMIARRNLLRSVRAESGCCSSGRDRSTCASSVARRRAERAHVVIANHSFVLARQEFLRHVIFDECEHIHDQARNAWSHTCTTNGLKRDLDAVFSLRAARGALADALEAAPSDSFIESCVNAAIDRHGQSERMLENLSKHLADYNRWRIDEERRRNPRDRHGVFREYIQNGPSAGLVTAHRSLLSSLAGLDAGLSALLDHIEELPSKRRERIRDRLATRRLALFEATTALDAWLPEDHEQATLAPRMSPAVFYTANPDEAERQATAQFQLNKAARAKPGNERMAAEVLLPQEELGRRYFPELESCVLISATTMIGGSFAAAARYLGLERLANPRADEGREPRDYRTFAVPEVFDYSRVLVGVPKDAPAVNDRDAYLAYFVRFTAHLARRTRGRILCLFTNARDLSEVGRALDEELVGSGIEIYAQNDKLAKEELADRFRARKESILLGVDTFWYGADFPGETLEYLIIARLPFGVPDDYHHAQIAAMGSGDQFKAVYMPRTLARFRQGFGRLMRKESDKGCVFILDKRVLEPRQRAFLRELPLATSDPALMHAPSKIAHLQAELARKTSRSSSADPFGNGSALENDPDGLQPALGGSGAMKTNDATESKDANNAAADDSPANEGARLVRGDTDVVLQAAFAHMEMLPDIARRGLDVPFSERRVAPATFNATTPTTASATTLSSEAEDDDRFTPGMFADADAHVDEDAEEQAASPKASPSNIAPKVQPPKPPTSTPPPRRPPPPKPYLPIDEPPF